MAKEARSKGACWTCRLRRKKCDELSPICVACSSHALPCYGYSKPDWADGGSMQKAKLEELRIIIREMASSKRLLLKQRMSKHSTDLRDSSSEIKSVDVSSIVPDTYHLTIDDATPKRNPPQHYAEIRKIFNFHLPNQHVDREMVEHDLSEELLTHYLDVVLPTQFPMSSDTKDASEWLLPLIVRVKPLYHTAISIAAYHKELSGESVGVRNYGNIHHGLALRELRRYLAESHESNLMASLESNIEVLATIVLLVYLEVLMGDTESWFIHLKGPLLLLPSLRTACNKRFILSPGHRRGLQFFVGVIVWYNALSCISTKLRPWAPTSCLKTAAHGWVNVHTITGCQNEVTISIIEIAKLSEEIERLGLQEPCMAATVQRIDTDLRRWVQPLGSSSETTSTDELVTRVFASAAQTYLSIVASAFDSNPSKISVSVCRALIALEAIADPHVLGTLAWPLCITGCMAAGWQRDVMKKIFISMSNVPSLQLGGMERCRKIIEECWWLQQGHSNAEADPQPTWIEAMDSLGLTVLLM
ncbi:fungal-specific transcription factor domain-containing protein [Rhexocercosporidium sp. MPI-PUGE-AT-0058]|nr:fungal-specific transcription factor domain-containing protein [Rhexocercosporidium sp. MPI-PUGE-AT-0058]